MTAFWKSVGFSLVGVAARRMTTASPPRNPEDELELRRLLATKLRALPVLVLPPRNVAVTMFVVMVSLSYDELNPKTRDAFVAYVTRAILQRKQLHS